MSICNVCAIHNDLDFCSNYQIIKTPLWVLRHHPHPSPLLGWILLDSNRHLSGPVDFSPDEAIAWGKAVQSSCKLLKEVSRCDRVYVVAFGEGAQHLHVHLIPRFTSNPLTKSWKVADYYRLVESGKVSSVRKEQIAYMVEKLRNQSVYLDFGD